MDNKQFNLDANVSFIFIPSTAAAVAVAFFGVKLLIDQEFFLTWQICMVLYNNFVYIIASFS